jgi:Ca2+/Na+ antiporter
MPDFFPKPPTDNLYKFMAITGTWLLSLVAVSLMFLGYMSFKIEKETNQIAHQMNYRQTIGEIDRRVLAIDEKRCNDAIISWSKEHECNDNEKKFLLRVKEVNEAHIKEYDKQDKIDFVNVWDTAKSIGVMWVFIIFTFLGVFLFYFGFTRWYKHIQKPENEAAILDIKIKKQIIEKNMLDIALTKKSSRTRFARH